MRTSAVLRICVAGELVLVALAVGLSLLLEDSLPPPLRDWLTAEADRELTTLEWFLLVALGVSMFLSLVASVGLLFLRRWAAWLYLISLLLGHFLYPFSGPTVEHAIPDTLNDISLVLAGLILGLAFLTDALRLPADTSEPTAETSTA